MTRGTIALATLLLLAPTSVAWAQGAQGERQFNQQMNQIRQQTRPKFQEIRGHFGSLRRQGVNTQQWEQQVNHVESMLNNARYQGPSASGARGPHLKSINPFGDFLFHGVPITPAPGSRLVTRHMDPTGLAQRAENWAKLLNDPAQFVARAHEMAADLRAITEKVAAERGAERDKFVASLNKTLAVASLSLTELKPATFDGARELKPSELGATDAPKLSGTTPMLLRNPFEDAGRAPGHPIGDTARAADPVPSPVPDAPGPPSVLQNLKDGTYFGTVAGEQSAQWYADRYVETGKWYYGAGGLASSLWTKDTWKETALTLGPEAAGMALKAVTYAPRLNEARISVSAVEDGLAGSIRNVNPTRGQWNCVHCSVATDATLDGHAASALPWGNPQGKSIGFLEDIYGAQFRPVSGEMQIGSILSQSGPGSRGIVFGSSPTGNVGHVFNAINKNGAIQFLDGQIGKSGLGNFGMFENFQFLLTHPGAR